MTTLFVYLGKRREKTKKKSWVVVTLIEFSSSFPPFFSSGEAERLLITITCLNHPPDYNLERHTTHFSFFFLFLLYCLQ